MIGSCCLELGCLWKNEKSPWLLCEVLNQEGICRVSSSDGKIVELNKDSNLFLGESGKVLRNENGVLFLTQDSVQLQRWAIARSEHQGRGVSSGVARWSIVWLNADSVTFR